MANLNFVEKEGEIEAEGRSPRKKLSLGQLDFQLPKVPLHGTKNGQKG